MGPDFPSFMNWLKGMSGGGGMPEGGMGPSYPFLGSGWMQKKPKKAAKPRTGAAAAQHITRAARTSAPRRPTTPSTPRPSTGGMSRPAPFSRKGGGY